MKKLFFGSILLFVLSFTACWTGIAPHHASAADERIKYNERAVGANHPIYSDTLNRLSLIEHNNDGTHNLLTQVTDPYIDIRAYGAIANDGLDDSTAVQNAINAAKGTSDTDPTLSVFFSSGTYNLATAITWHDSNIIGQQSTSGVRIVWDGAPGATVFTKPVATRGGSSHGIMEGIAFRGGVNEPATWIDLTANLIDKDFKLSRIVFGGNGDGLGCTGDAIKVGEWINLHWEDLRFDEVGGYAIRATPPALQHLSTFIIDKFTYDHHRSSGPASGMIIVDNSADNTNLGTFEISNGRIEINDAWTGNQAIVTFKVPDPPSGGKSLGLILKNVTYHDSASMASDCVLYRDTADTGSRDMLILDNFKSNSLSTVLGGTWPSDQYLPSSASNIDRVAINPGFNGVLELGHLGQDAFIFYRSQVSTDNTLATGVSTDADNRFELLSNGKLSWGNGTDAVDTNLYRVGVGKLKTDGSIVKAIGTLADDATPSIAAGGDIWTTGGTTPITDIDDGTHGQIITLLAEHTITITDGTNILLNGSANFDMTNTDTLTLIYKTDNRWYEISRGDNGA